MAILVDACSRVGLDTDGATSIRLGENAIYRLPTGIVVRIARVGQLAAAQKEVNVARWLEASGIPAVRVLSDVVQPVDVCGRAVTFWYELPPHEAGTPIQVADALRRLHSLAPPTNFQLPSITPFVRLAERIDNAVTLTEDDQKWMRSHLLALHREYAELPAGLPACVVHGDAWVGNIVSTGDGNVLFLDLERCSIGAPEWDLVHTAIKYTSFGWIGSNEYTDFVRHYGHDVSAWDGFRTLRDIREFRMTCMAAQVAAENPSGRDQAAHRLACIRGEQGPRPWSGWYAVP